MKSHNADKTDIGLSDLAGAAFLRECSGDLLAVQRISPNQPFRLGIKRQFQTDLSLRAGSTIGSQDKTDLASLKANGRFRLEAIAAKNSMLARVDC